MPVAESKDQQIHWHEIVFICAVQLLLALIATYPLVMHFNSTVIGGGDSVQNAWNLWWVRRAVSQGDLLPFYTTMLYHPTGVSLAFHTLGLLNGWIGLLLQAGLGLSLVSSYNVITLAAFVVTGLTTYLLVRSLTGTPTAAFAASIILTYAPIRMSRVFFGNLEVYSTQFIPLTALAVIKMLQTGQRRYAVVAAIAFAATAGISLELALGTGLLVGLLLVFHVVENRRKLLERKREVVRTWVLLGIASLILVSPVVLPMVLDLSDFHDQSDQSAASDYNNADLLGFFIPDHATQPLITRSSPAIARFVGQTYGRFYGNPCEKTVFVGYTVLALSLVAALMSKSRTMREWLVMAGAFFVLSLGPVLRVAGQPILHHLPYEWLNRLPLIGFGRTPSRFAVFLMLALAVVSGYGMAALEARYPKLKWFTPLIGILIFLEFLVAPLRLEDRIADIPAYYAELAVTQDGGAAILDVPVDLGGAQGPAGDYMLYQIVHGKPIVSGYISRTPSSALWPFEHPFLNELRARIYGDTSPYHFSEEVLSQAAAELRLLDVGYVVLHRDELSDQDFETVHAALETVLSASVYEDDRLTVWKVE